MAQPRGRVLQLTLVNQVAVVDVDDGATQPASENVHIRQGEPRMVVPESAFSKPSVANEDLCVSTVIDWKEAKNRPGHGPFVKRGSGRLEIGVLVRTGGLFLEIVAKDERSRSLVVRPERCSLQGVCEADAAARHPMKTQRKR